MKGGSKLFIFAGVALALVAVILGIASFTNGTKTGAQNSPVTTTSTVVEALKAVPAHTVLTAADVVEKQVPSTEAVTGIVTSAGAVIGQSYSAPLTIGQRLQSSLVEIPGLANVIKPGLRAMSLPVTSVSALSGLIQENNYVDIIFHARINPVRLLPTGWGQLPEDTVYTIKETSPVVQPASTPTFPAAGDPGSLFQIRDGVGDEGQLEPVAKILLQDIHVLRVVAPGGSFGSDGSIAIPTVTTDGAGVSQEGKVGQLIVEVTPQQAEVITFIQDPKHQYQVIVRGKGDHSKVDTTGITFEILATEPAWQMPWPKSITSPAGTPTAQGAATTGGAGKGGASTGNGT